MTTSTSTESTTIELCHQGVDLRVDVYQAAHDGPAPAALVLPGGGFREITRHDGEGYARWLNAIGMSAVVLHYELVPDPFPLAVQQARTAFDALRTGALVPDVDAARVGVIGSSAGGLLAGLVATGTVLSFEPPATSGSRPAFHIQSYGVADLSLLPSSAVEALLGNMVGHAPELSPATHVDAHTPPTFVWATGPDAPGLPNALQWAQVLTEHEVPVELHVYPEGGHGVGLADGVPYGAHGHERMPHTAEWTAACERWLRWLHII